MKSRSIFQSALMMALLALVFSLAVRAQSNGDFLKGVVRTSSGGGVYASVWVIVRQGGYEKGRSLTGDDGKYYISNLYDGVYDITVYQGTRELHKERVELRSDTRRHDISIR
ncbi:MAG: carboxypeptidase regulatory-like domain-containing protein [Acidobacteria bacterium]|nr:carboxypeptidase regulatory-like domain-containing protein [Acidobacteriota bacterium]